MTERAEQLLEALCEGMAKLTAAVESLAEKVSRDSRATLELAQLRGAAAERKRRERAAKSRDSHAPLSRECPVTEGTIGVSSGSSTDQQEKIPLTPVTRLHVTAGEHVWAFWKSHLGKTSTAKFDRKRQRAVESRLKDGYTVDQLCEAIRGCKLDPFSMGENDRRTRYDDLSLICRDAAHVDKFIGFAAHPPAPAVNGARPGAARLQFTDEQRAEHQVEGRKFLSRGTP